ncbi:TPA: class I SAM-dependent methyltransferase, partial [Escherichia coli]|nr:class I SAM-dependent methyltransferase [Escherichia coli]
MDSQKISQLVENRELYPITDIGGELNFIFKSSLFWRPTYLAQSAWLEHIPFAFWLVDTLRPRNIVELGTHYGSSYFSFCQAVSKLDLETCCFAVDTWGGDEHAGLYGEEVYRQVSEYNQQHYSGFSTLIRSTFDQALEHFSQGSIDLLHIDGLHTFEAVRHDFESWLPKLSERAVVIMHDTNVRERGFGVFQLLDELKRQYPHFEFAHGHGL